MSLLRRLLRLFRRPRARPRAGYGAEVLFAGWVELPAALKGTRGLRIPRP